MELKQIKGTSKKTGKEYTAYCVQIGEYRTPLFLLVPFICLSSIWRSFLVIIINYTVHKPTITV